MQMFNWAIVGPGKIAHRFADAVQHLGQAQMVWVCGRDLARASEFVSRHSAKEAHQAIRVTLDLDEVLRDPQVHGVYVATPHAQHGDVVRACLVAGKPVLCEKPLVPTAAQAKALIELSQERGVFLMEALWTRFLPIFSVVGDWLRSGAIGPIRHVNSSFCFNAPYTSATADTRLYNPALAGGALLDIGIYNLSLTRWALSQATGCVPELRSFTASGVLAPSGVDQRVQAQFTFLDPADPSGMIGAHMVCAFDANAPNSLHIMGSLGHIEVGERFWEGTTAVLHRPGQASLFEERAFAANGFEYEVQAAIDAIKAGRIECTEISHQETLQTAVWLDALRQQTGVRYPFE